MAFRWSMLTSRPARLAGAGMAAAARRRAEDRAGPLTPGATTVVIVNWNTLPFLKVAVAALRRFGPPDLSLTVVDNRSRDASRAFLRAAPPEVRTILLPANVGHENALDLGVLGATTEFVVTLDPDAFPVRRGWLDALLDPLREGAAVSGAHVERGFVHPCCLAMRVERFVGRGHSFRSRYSARRIRPDLLGTRRWDVGERISMRERGRVHLIDATETAGPGRVGTLFGDVVYHNFFSSHATKGWPLTELDRDTPLRAWFDATERFGLGDVARRAFDAER